MSRCLFLSLAATLLLATPAVHGAEVYQWKDANGVTHYSQTPPPRGAYQQRQVNDRGSSTPLQASAQAAAPQPQDATSPDTRCTMARSNVDALSGSGPVQQAGENGQPPRALNDAERAAQLDLARAAVRAYCG